ncbi:MAG: helix-turn-helix domain-containing protein, partial [Candidatus Anstonellales archaeon]
MKEEIRELILKALKENPEVFPSSTQIAKLIENKYGMKISESTIRLNIELSSLQKKWIEECEDEEFLENISNKSLSKVEGEVKEARDRRFKEIVNKVLGENKEVFPGSPQIAKLIENKYVEYGVKISGATILRNIELSSLQKKWIEECEDREFLENFSNKSLNNVEGEVKEARDRRFKE